MGFASVCSRNTAFSVNCAATAAATARPRLAAGRGPQRAVREARRAAHLRRRYDYLSPFGGRRLLAPFEDGVYGDGLPKRNFDEIDRSNLNSFVKKRNFDEIDQTSLPFPFKRFYPLVGHNYLDIPLSSLDKKHYRSDYPMDEIDFSQFPIGSKRSPQDSDSPHYELP